MCAEPILLNVWENIYMKKFEDDLINFEIRKEENLISKFIKCPPGYLNHSLSSQHVADDVCKDTWNSSNEKCGKWSSLQYEVDSILYWEFHLPFIPFKIFGLLRDTGIVFCWILKFHIIVHPRCVWSKRKHSPSLMSLHSGLSLDKRTSACFIHLGRGQTNLAKLLLLKRAFFC